MIRLLVLLLLVTTTAFGAPSIDEDGITGPISNGESVTIEGASFGSKSTATPFNWDNFEAHTNGTDFDVDTMEPIYGPTWTAYKLSPETDDVKISTTRAHGGTKSVYIEWDAESVNSFGWANEGPFSTLYISFWAYQHWDSGHSDAQLSADIKTCNRKWFYLFGNGSLQPRTKSLIPGGIDEFGANSDHGTEIYGGVEFYDTHDVWQRWEYVIILESPYTSTDTGVFQHWLSGVEIFNRTNYNHRDTDHEWIDFRLGHMWQGQSGSADGPYVYIDDVYIDSTRARVEIGNNATFANCTHREIQIPTAWADDEITVTINQGSFSPEDTIYFFVVDSDGVASTGKAETMGAGGTDLIAPYTAGWNPSKLAIDVNKNTTVIAHVLDSGVGVDNSTIVLTVDGEIVTPVITGTSADYTLTYTPEAAFNYDQVVPVRIDADDLNGNSMVQDSYVFTVESSSLTPELSLSGNVTLSGNVGF